MTQPPNTASHQETSPPKASNMETSFGFQQVAPGAKQGLVNKVFSSVAGRYDLMNDLMSGGMHRLWKDDLINWLAPSRSRSDFTLLDVAGGTGDITLRFLKAAAPTARSVICDISAEMMLAGKERADMQPFLDRITHVDGNAESLPFPDDHFDAYTIAFGIRNVPKIDLALAEAHRVLKPGGRFLCLEFSEVTMPMLDKAYDLFSFHAIPAIGKVAAGDAESYRYLVESIRQFPKQDKFEAMIKAAGFEQTKYRNLSGGIAALHSGWKI